MQKRGKHTTAWRVNTQQRGGLTFESDPLQEPLSTSSAHMERGPPAQVTLCPVLCHTPTILTTTLEYRLRYAIIASHIRHM